MSSLIRSLQEIANQVEVSSINREITDDKLEEKLEEVEKVEDDNNNITENSAAGNESHER